MSVFISGASRGIGRALAADLTAAGHRVTAVSRSGDVPAECTGLIADVTSLSAVREAVRAAESASGPVSLAIANAGVLGPVGPSWEIDEREWWAAFETNVRGVMNVAKATLPGMVARGAGRLVLMSSGMGSGPSPWSSAYGASKAAVTQLAGSLGRELLGSGVSVFAISPGMVRTDMTDWPAEIRIRRPELDGLTNADFWDVSHVLGLVRDISSGRLDPLSGSFVHVRDDREALLAQAMLTSSHRT